MKKLFCLSLALVTMAPAAFAQTAPYTPGYAPYEMERFRGQPDDRFEAHKARILAGMHRTADCVRTSTNENAMEACFPTGDQPRDWRQ